MPHLRVVPLERGAVLHESGNALEHVYFPHSGMVAAMGPSRLRSLHFDRSDARSKYRADIAVQRRIYAKISRCESPVGQTSPAHFP
jgi:hypothetical protein